MKVLLIIIGIFLFLVIVHWMRTVSRNQKNQLTKPEKEFIDSILELLKYLDNFELPTSSEDYYAKVFSATLANKNLLIDIRLHPHSYNYKKVILYRHTLDALYALHALEAREIESLQQRIAACKDLRIALKEAPV